MIRVPDDITMVVLDMDGTIYRKPKMAWYMLLRQWCHLPSLVAERLYRKRQRAALSTQPSAVSGQPFSDTWYRQCYLPAMVDIIREHYRPQEWVQPLLDECKQRDIPVIILSDYEAVNDKLRALGLAPEAFAAIMATSDLGTIKPDLRLGEMIVAKLKHAAIDWRHVLFIGDRQDTDGLLAHALGAQFIQV